MLNRSGAIFPTRASRHHLFAPLLHRAAVHSGQVFHSFEHEFLPSFEHKLCASRSLEAAVQGRFLSALFLHVCIQNMLGHFWQVIWPVLSYSYLISCSQFNIYVTHRPGCTNQPTVNSCLRGHIWGFDMAMDFRHKKIFNWFCIHFIPTLDQSSYPAHPNLSQDKSNFFLTLPRLADCRNIRGSTKWKEFNIISSHI